MADASGVTIRLFAKEFPVLGQARELASMGVLPTGAYANSTYLEGKVSFADHVARETRDLAFDPLSLPESEARELMRVLPAAAPWARVIGEVLPAGPSAILVE